MNFGAVGVILWFLLLGLLVRFLYSKSAYNIYWLIVYVLSIPVIVFSTRGDFSILLAQFGKHVLIPLLIIYLCGAAIKKHSS